MGLTEDRQDTHTTTLTRVHKYSVLRGHVTCDMRVLRGHVTCDMRVLCGHVTCDMRVLQGAHRQRPGGAPQGASRRRHIHAQRV